MATFSTIDLIACEPRFTDAYDFNYPNFEFPGGCATASTTRFPFSQNLNIIEANMLICLIPHNDGNMRLVHFDAGMKNLTNLGSWLNPPNKSTPISTEMNVTQAMQDLNAAGVDKFIGIQLAGHIQVALARLEITFG